MTVSALRAEEIFLRMSAEELGDVAEGLWEKVVAACGMHYIPLHRIEDRGAPMQRGDDGLVLPDLDISAGRHNLYADSKGKRHPVLFRLANEWRHGIEKHSWQFYDAISARNRRHCCVAIFECFRDEDNSGWSGALLINSLFQLGKPFAGHGTMASTVFWPRSRFVRAGAASAAEALGLVPLGHYTTRPIRECLRPLFDELGGDPIQLRIE